MFGSQKEVERAVETLSGFINSETFSNELDS